MKQIAFLRGVNVGGKNRVPMKELAAALSEVGFTGVSTYIQSGNILFDHADNAADLIEKLIAERFSVNTKVVLRNADELEKIVISCPYSEDKAYITLLSDNVANFPPIDGKGDEYTHCGDVIYICMNGAAHESKLQNAVFEKRTGFVATTRNLRTLTELVKRSNSDKECE